MVGQVSVPVIDARASLARATFLKRFSGGASNKMLARHRQAETPVPLIQATHPVTGANPVVALPEGDKIRESSLFLCRVAMRGTFRAAPRF